MCGENERGGQCRLLLVGSSPRVRGKLHEELMDRASNGFIPACAGKTTQRPPTCSTVQVHPRVCGENSSKAVVGAVQSGSSPRVRGKPPTPRASAASMRFIPACAGKTSRSFKESPSQAVHPRVCGENTPVLVSSDSQPGSSPRVRGKPPNASSRSSTTRFIPACAGKTPWTEERRQGLRVHPRVCGENLHSADNGNPSDGSSPRVRGKH